MAFKLSNEWGSWPLLLSGILLNIILWVLVFTVFDRSNPNAVLHYSVDIGIDFVGQGIKIVTLPLIGSLVLLLNGVLGIMVYRTEIRISWVLWAVIPLIQLILLGSFLLLLRLNTGTDAISYSLQTFFS